MPFILLVGIALALLVATGGLAREAPGALSADELGYVIYYGALAVLVGSAVLVIARRRPSRALQAAGMWIVIAFVLVLAYSYRIELAAVGDRVLSELVPGRASVRADRTVEIVRGRGGDFQVAAQVNGVRVAMALDTGATAVVLTQDAAKAAGLPLDVLHYDVPIETANGRTRAASVTLDRLSVGGILERSIPALVAQPGQLHVSLLGMSFLNRLESWEVRGDRLLMRGYP